MLPDFDAISLRNAYTVYGDRGNPAIVFVHGIRLGRQIWDEHARRLCDEFYVLTLDLPGHGTLAHVPFTAENVEAVLAHVVADAVTHGPPVLVGYSLGGYACVGFAHDFPQHVAALVLAGSTVDIVGWRAALYRLAVRVTDAVPDMVIDRFLAAFFRLTLPKRVADVIIPFPFRHRVFREACEASNDERYSELLRAYTGPVLILNGAWDAFRLDEQRFARVAGATVQHIPHADHVAPLRRPEDFSERVRAFARQVFTACRSSDSRS